MKTIAWGAGLFLAAFAVVMTAIFAISALSFVLISALKVGLFATAVYIAFRIGKKLLAKA